MTQINRNHWIELVIRSSIFILTIITYILKNPILQHVTNLIIWGFFMFKMIRRLIPKKIESMGNQKIFAKNYIQGKIEKKKREYIEAMAVAIVWLLLNTNFFILHFVKIIDQGIMLLISLFYSVCDMICILVVCPFQKLFMKNKCCNTCRIYNWDFAMMFTPLLAIPTLYNYSLALMAIVVLIVWEVTYCCHPERFHEESNCSLECRNCKELMCKNKWRKIKNTET